MNGSTRTGAEPVLLNGEPLPFHLRDLWRWSASDLPGDAQAF